jgi:hypothetical protein
MAILLKLGIDLHNPRHVEIAGVEKETNHAAVVVNFPVGGGDDARLRRVRTAIRGLGARISRRRFGPY